MSFSFIRVGRTSYKVSVDHSNVSYHSLRFPIYNRPPLFATIVHFTVACQVTWPLNGSEAGGDLALIQTSLLYYVNAYYFASKQHD